MILKLNIMKRTYRVTVVLHVFHSDIIVSHNKLLNSLKVVIARLRSL